MNFYGKYLRLGVYFFGDVLAQLMDLWAQICALRPLISRLEHVFNIIMKHMLQPNSGVIKQGDSIVADMTLFGLWEAAIQS